MIPCRRIVSSSPAVVAVAVVVAVTDDDGASGIVVWETQSRMLGRGSQTKGVVRRAFVGSSQYATVLGDLQQTRQNDTSSCVFPPDR